jgi:hypothetical protein
MRLIVITVIAAVLLPLEAEARGEREKLACDAVKEKIRTIESKMRSGYTRAQGERYEAKLRELKTKRYRLCR